MEEEKILKFYDAFVSFLTKHSSNEIFKEFINALLCGHELESSGECSPKLYEYILTFNTLAISNSVLKEEQLTLYPFSIIDEKYYEGVIKQSTIDDIINYRRMLFLNKLAIDIDQKDNMYTLVKEFYPSYIEVFEQWSKVNDILRQGWIKRNINHLIAESDSMHSVQMLALASICMRIYKLEHLDKQRVYEMIIIHEIAEVIVGDIVEGSNEHLTKSERERAAIYKIFEPLKNREYFINLWEEFEERKSEEAKFVYQLDKIDPVLKARYLDKKLHRDDLFDDFYDYEDNRATFIDTPLQKLFYSNMY